MSVLVRKGVHTSLVILPVPIRITGDVLRLLVLLLLSASIEHILEELKLR